MLAVNTDCSAPQLVQHIKPIKGTASATLTELAKELIKYGEAEGTSEARRAFVDFCQPVLTSSDDVRSGFSSKCFAVRLTVSPFVPL